MAEFESRGLRAVVPSGRAGRYALIADLDAEWAQLSERSDPIVRGWAEAARVLQCCRTLADVLAAIRTDPDPALTALLTEAAQGDILAGRVVLQAWWARCAVGADLSRPRRRRVRRALWCRIRTYPLDRRPTKIAANLALDTRKDALATTRGARRERASDHCPSPAGSRSSIADPIERPSARPRRSQSLKLARDRTARPLFSSTRRPARCWRRCTSTGEQPIRRPATRHHPGHGALSLQSGPRHCRGTPRPSALPHDPFVRFPGFPGHNLTSPPGHTDFGTDYHNRRRYEK